MRRKGIYFDSREHKFPKMEDPIMARYNRAFNLMMAVLLAVLCIALTCFATGCAGRKFVNLPTIPVYDTSEIEGIYFDSKFQSQAASLFRSALAAMIEQGGCVYGHLGLADGHPTLYLDSLSQAPSDSATDSALWYSRGACSAGPVVGMVHTHIVGDNRRMNFSPLDIQGFTRRRGDIIVLMLWRLEPADPRVVLAWQLRHGLHGHYGIQEAS